MGVISFSEKKLDQKSVLVMWNGLKTGISPDTGQPFPSFDKELQSISIYNPRPLDVGMGQFLYQGDMPLQAPQVSQGAISDLALGVAPMALGGWSNAPTPPEPSEVGNAWDTLVVPLFDKFIEPELFTPIVGDGPGIYQNLTYVAGQVNQGGPGTGNGTFPAASAIKLSALSHGRWMWFIPPNPFALVTGRNIPESINVYALFSSAY